MSEIIHGEVFLFSAIAILVLLFASIILRMHMEKFCYRSGIKPVYKLMITMGGMGAVMLSIVLLNIVYCIYLSFQNSTMLGIISLLLALYCGFIGYIKLHKEMLKY